MAAPSPVSRLPSTGVDGRAPTPLLLAQDGLLYGTSHKGTTAGAGSLFRIGLDGSGFTVLTNFVSSGRQAHQNALVQGADGGLYGTTCYSTNDEVLFRVSTNDGTWRVLHYFTPGSGEGTNADTALLEGADGALYGVALNGGAYGGGTLFRVNTDGTGYAILHHFGADEWDGRTPTDGVVQGPDGRLYGSTLRGGAGEAGTLYAIGIDGSGYVVLRNFRRFGGDAQGPSGGLASGADGFLYGTSCNGGTNDGGTLFRLGPDGLDYAIWHHFGAAGDGRLPSGKLVQGTDGAWYGTTFMGGSNACGTLFRLSADGGTYAVLYGFTGLDDGDAPSDALVPGSNSVLYGTTAAGGTNGAGTVFAFDPVQGMLTVLHAFATNTVDGTGPAGGLLRASTVAFTAPRRAGAPPAPARFQARPGRQWLPHPASISNQRGGRHVPRSRLDDGCGRRAVWHDLGWGNQRPRDPVPAQPGWHRLQHPEPTRRCGAGGPRTGESAAPSE